MVNEVCKFFNLCGGCQIQGVPVEQYLDRKSFMLSQLFEKNHIVVGDILPIISFNVGIRRRASLKIDFGNNIGFYKKSSNDVVGIDSCQLLNPIINSLISPLRKLFNSFVKRSDGALFITCVDNGVCIDFIDINITLLDLPKIKDFATNHNIIRVSDGKNVLFQSLEPVISFNSIAVPYPINSFLQPSIEGQNAIVESVLKLIDTKHNVADLFCGLGLFSFYLYDMVESIASFDCDVKAIQNINKVAKKLNLNIIAKDVDLFKKPISSDKLNQFDLVVMDPPREGAKNQALQIANSSLKHIIYVSCNPNSFIKDVQILINAGFKIRSIQPIDQFSYTNHLELVADIYR